jgi:Family of unknown function (DUF6352)
MKDFWLSCGHHLLDRDKRGRLRVTDEFMKVYMARPELALPPEACVAERILRSALLSDPWRTVAATEIGAIADSDARENWQFMISLRDRLAAHRTLEATYAALVHEGVPVPPIFLDQLVHLILRNALDQCDDPHMLRAAELFFRPQRLTIHDGSLLAADNEQIEANGPVVPPLAAMFGLPAEPEIEVLCDNNVAGYWDRSDRFDFALDLTAGRYGIVALGAVIARWVKHLLDIDVVVESLNELRGATFRWYVGLDADGTRIGDALWSGAELDEETRIGVVGLFRLTFCDADLVMDQMAGEPVYLILAMTPNKVLRMKPQNLLTGLPIRRLETVT